MGAFFDAVAKSMAIAMEIMRNCHTTGGRQQENNSKAKWKTSGEQRKMERTPREPQQRGTGARAGRSGNGRPGRAHGHRQTAQPSGTPSGMADGWPTDG